MCYFKGETHLEGDVKMSQSKLNSYGDLIGELYHLDYVDGRGEPYSFRGYVENFSPSGVIALHGLNGLVVVKASKVELFRPLTLREIAQYHKKELEAEQITE